MEFKEHHPTFHELLKSDSVRYIHLNANTLYMIDELCMVCDNLVVHDIRKIPFGWRAQLELYNCIYNKMLLARQGNKKHVIVTKHCLPVSINKLINMEIDHVEGDATFNYWLLDRCGNRIY